MLRKLHKLEALRGFAALYVFAGHLLLERVIDKHSIGGFFLRFGQEAVVLFFIISGFVVYYSTVAHKDTSFATYFWRRFRRIYPIFLLALLVSYLCAAISLGEMPGVNGVQLLGNLLMLQDFKSGKPGVWIDPFLGNTPLWSLAYEWWFYMMFFPMFLHVPNRFQLHLVALISSIGFVTYSFAPNQISLFLLYFMLWWSGVELARTYLNGKQLSLHSQRTILIYLTGLTALTALPLVYAQSKGSALEFGVHPVLEFRHFFACLMLIVGGLMWHRARWKGFESLLGVFSVVSPISYAIYVFHYPLAVSSTYLSNLPSSQQVLGYAVITIALAFLAEGPFQNYLNRRFPISSRSQRRNESKSSPT